MSSKGLELGGERDDLAQQEHVVVVVGRGEVDDPAGGEVAQWFTADDAQREEGRQAVEDDVVG